MNIILLSGGSGRRLWPLSNDTCSKQYIKIIDLDQKIKGNESEEKCSMLQRVYNQLGAVGLAERTIIAASESQVELINSQLESQVEIAVEPSRRDTFPAVMLACAYLFSEKKADLNEPVAILPVDPYVDVDFFEKIDELGRVVAEREDTIGLLGGIPTYPSSKYGYIIPTDDKKMPLTVKGFKEKPTEEQAEKLIAEGGLWNCGVFCFKLGLAEKWLKKYKLPLDYKKLHTDYEMLPKISFDYEVLEHWTSIIALTYDKMWKDLGTWNTLTEEMKERSIGKVTWDKVSEGSYAVNVLDIPMVIMGAKDMVIAASHDGILVADRHQSSYIKECLNDVDMQSRFEERRWGTKKTIDVNMEEEVQSMTNRIKMLEGKDTSYHRHLYHDENIVIISGEGILKTEDEVIQLKPGISVQIKTQKAHGIRAVKGDLRYIETLVGNLEQDDVERISMEW